MDYEELYDKMQVIEKDIKDKLVQAQKCYKSLTKKSAEGDLKSISKDLAQMNSFIKDYEALTAGYTEIVEGFNIGEYMGNGDFAQQMTEYCKKASVDIKGEYPVYEMFPYKVKIDSENCELNIDRKKLQCVRPQHFVSLIKKSQEKLNKASFNESIFLNELAAAYDAAVLDKEKSGNSVKNERDILLRDLYPYMVPMQRFRREYDIQNFAFDLARLYVSDLTNTKDGRGFEFGTSRYIGKQIRILDRDGNEQYIGTIRFFTC